MSAPRAFIKLTGLALAMGAAGGGVIWWQYKANDTQRIIESQRQEIEYLSNVAERLVAERRVARIVVTEQKRNDAGQLVTDMLFFDVNDVENKDDTLPPKAFTVVGETVHVDARVIKFDNAFVREGDQFRGKTIALWDRIYGSAVAPEEGESIDPAGEAPEVYKGDPSETGLDKARRQFEAGLWDEFWQLARDPEYAKTKGIRVVHGQGVYGIFEPGYVYDLTLEADGGLSLYSKPMPGMYRELLKLTKPGTLSSPPMPPISDGTGTAVPEVTPDTP